jgi:dephospho-CoA kinase
VLRVGLTGGIASGKSQVLARWRELGLDTVDLDRVAHGAIAPGGAAYADVVAAFGPAILNQDGTVDRKALGAVVFADATARARLNAIVHPRVRAEEARHAREASADAVVVTDAALLVESGVHLRFDRLVVVHCGSEEQVRRVMARDGIDAAAARARVAAQMPPEDKVRFAHHVVDSSGPKAETLRAVDQLAEQFRELASSRPSRLAVSDERLLAAAAAAPSGPGGLTAARLLEDIASAGGLEMERVARLLHPPASGPWYEAASSAPPAAPAWTLAAPLVAWCLERGGPDAEFTVAAAASLARLTHREPAAIADACLAALVVQQALTALRPRGADAAMRALAARWGGAEPTRTLEGDPALRAVLEGAAAGLAVGRLSEIDRALGALRSAFRPA